MGSSPEAFITSLSSLRPTLWETVCDSLGVSGETTHPRPFEILSCLMILIMYPPPLPYVELLTLSYPQS